MSTCTTTAVPSHIAEPLLLSLQQHKRLVKEWGCAMKLPLKVFDAVAMAAKNRPTWIAYNTQGDVRKGEVGERAEILVDQAKTWIIESCHSKTLKSICTRFEAKYDDILAVDRSIRMVRARGTTVVNGKTLFYAYNSNASEGEIVCSWLDISLNPPRTRCGKLQPKENKLKNTRSKKKGIGGRTYSMM